MARILYFQPLRLPVAAAVVRMSAKLAALAVAAVVAVVGRSAQEPQGLGLVVKARMVQTVAA
jgi:hypothetical protein